MGFLFRLSLSAKNFVFTATFTATFVVSGATSVVWRSLISLRLFCCLSDSSLILFTATLLSFSATFSLLLSSILLRSSYLCMVEKFLKMSFLLLSSTKRF